MLLCNGSDNSCSIASIFLVDILNYFFPSFMLEVHIDIRWFITCRGNEPLEEQIEFGRINRSNTKTIANSGISSRAPSLTKNMLLPGETYNIIHSEKIRSVTHLFDERQFIINSVDCFLRDNLTKTLMSPLPCEISK